MKTIWNIADKKMSTTFSENTLLASGCPYKEYSILFISNEIPMDIKYALSRLSVFHHPEIPPKDHSCLFEGLKYAYFEGYSISHYLEWIDKLGKMVE